MTGLNLTLNPDELPSLNEPARELPEPRELNSGDPCPKCGEPLDMYYRPICFVCERPIVTAHTSFNLIKSLNWLEKHGYEGIKDRVWGDLCDTFNLSNDSFFSIGIPSESYEHYGNEIDKLIDGLRELYGPGEFLVEVSW